MSRKCRPLFSAMDSTNNFQSFLSRDKERERERATRGYERFLGFREPGEIKRRPFRRVGSRGCGWGEQRTSISSRLIPSFTFDGPFNSRKWLATDSCQNGLNVTIWSLSFILEGAFTVRWSCTEKNISDWIGKRNIDDASGIIHWFAVESFSLYCTVFCHVDFSTVEKQSYCGICSAQVCHRSCEIHSFQYSQNTLSIKSNLLLNETQ